MLPVLFLGSIAGRVLVGSEVNRVVSQGQMYESLRHEVIQTDDSRLSMIQFSSTASGATVAMHNSRLFVPSSHEPFHMKLKVTSH